jgi:hypothetical protein
MDALVSFGSRRRFDRGTVTSGLPRSTDILRGCRHVSKVPIADMIKEAERRPRWLLVIELFESDYANLWIGAKVRLPAVLDAFAFLSTVIGFKSAYNPDFKGSNDYRSCAIDRDRMLGGRKKEGRSPLSRLVPTIAPMVSVAATYIGAADDVGPSPIHGRCADAAARTADHCNALDVRRLELS